MVLAPSWFPPLRLVSDNARSPNESRANECDCRLQSQPLPIGLCSERVGAAHVDCVNARKPLPGFDFSGGAFVDVQSGRREVALSGPIHGFEVGPAAATPLAAARYRPLIVASHAQDPAGPATDPNSNGDDAGPRRTWWACLVCAMWSKPWACALSALSGQGLCGGTGSAGAKAKYAPTGS